VCYLAVPYPYCYYLSSSGEDGSEVRLHFTRNTFFSDCSQTKNVFLDTRKGVAVYFDGVLRDRYDNEDLCLPEPSSR
jgi:hypothetical protein